MKTFCLWHSLKRQTENCRDSRRTLSEFFLQTPGFRQLYTWRALKFTFLKWFLMLETRLGLDEVPEFSGAVIFARNSRDYSSKDPSLGKGSAIFFLHVSRRNPRGNDRSGWYQIYRPIGKGNIPRVRLLARSVAGDMSASFTGVISAFWLDLCALADSINKLCLSSPIISKTLILRVCCRLGLVDFLPSYTKQRTLFDFWHAHVSHRGSFALMIRLKTTYLNCSFAFAGCKRFKSISFASVHVFAVCVKTNFRHSLSEIGMVCKGLGGNMNQ